MGLVGDLSIVELFIGMVIIVFGFGFLVLSMGGGGLVGGIIFCCIVFFNLFIMMGFGL